MEKLRGVVERITYANEETGYSVVKLAVKDYSDLVTLVGSMASVHVGTVIEADGRWSHNPKFGRQFEVASWRETLPATTYGIQKYLGSGLIKGIGPIFAKKIVAEFGEETLTILEEAPEKLQSIEGIGPKRVRQIQEAWQQQKEIKNVMLFLQSHNISTAFGNRIFKAYGNNSIAMIKENPYRMADDIFGIGFKTADQLAEKLGFDVQSPLRVRSGLVYVLNQLAGDGHCFAEGDTLVTAAQEILSVNADIIRDVLIVMDRQEDLIFEDEAYYLPPFFFSERGTAKRLAAMQRMAEQPPLLDMETKQPAGEIDYDPVQKEAIDISQRSKLMVLTGGPGTGKTTTIRGIIAQHQAKNRRILLAAPTGRAAKRMSEASGLEAKTIHRLLEYQPSEGYKRNEENPLLGDVLIIDEASMVDIVLMYNLLKAVPDSMTLLLVGDVDQLPSVGPGNVLRDCIDSGVIPTVRLTKIFRQAQGSRIITNAHRINKGQMPDLTPAETSNFFFVESADTMVEVIVDLCRRRLPTYYRVDPIRDIQVLTPMQRSETGAANLNARLQEALNPQSKFLTKGPTQYGVGDKVMQIRNNYEKEVFNGDIGQIVSVSSEEQSLVVAFDGGSIAYESLELDELVLAYATTIHKAQGSEYRIVVMPISFSHYVMLQRNLLYTGVTRAKEVLVLVGDKRAIAAAVHNADQQKRRTRLAQRLLQEMGGRFVH